MEEEKNLKETELSNEEMEEELETEASEQENLEQMRRDIQKRNEKKMKKLQEQQKTGGKKCRISGIVAAIAGVIELLAGLMNGNSTNLVLGLTFMCIGYFYYNLGKKLDKKKILVDKRILMDTLKLRDKDEFINLSQLLKAMNLVESGAMAKEVIDEGLVKVDGEIESRYRRKLYDGMIVEFNGEQIQVVK